MARARYVARAQYSPRTPWYQRLPGPLQRAALGVWSIVPGGVRSLLAPMGAVFGRHTVTSRAVPGADAVPGVVQLRAQGFEPVEEHTGALWIGPLWPEPHRRSVAETRQGWIGHPRSDGQVWLVRSPWPACTVEDVFALLWPWVEGDRTHDDAVLRSRAAELLGWDEARLLAWRRELEGE